MEQEPPASRFARKDQVYASYHDYVCYLALDRTTGVQVFWYEFINTALAPEQQEVAYRRLVDAKRINSKYLLQILEVRRETNKFIVVTEATQSPSVYDYLRTLDSPPLLKTLLKWFKLACLAVQALHKADVVHGSLSLHSCYLKPSTGGFKMRLPLTSLSLRCIPPCALNVDEYKAPEQLSGVKAKSNDIWALGIALLEMVTHQTAYSECKTPHDLISALAGYQMPEALKLVEKQEVAALIRACLAPESSRPTIDALLSHPVMTENVSQSGSDLGFPEVQPLIDFPTNLAGEREPSEDIIELK